MRWVVPSRRNSNGVAVMQSDPSRAVDSLFLSVAAPRHAASSRSTPTRSSRAPESRAKRAARCAYARGATARAVRSLHRLPVRTPPRPGEARAIALAAAPTEPLRCTLTPLASQRRVRSVERPSEQSIMACTFGSRPGRVPRAPRLGTRECRRRALGNLSAQRPRLAHQLERRGCSEFARRGNHVAGARPARVFTARARFADRRNRDGQDRRAREIAAAIAMRASLAHRRSRRRLLDLVERRAFTQTQCDRREHRPRTHRRKSLTLAAIARSRRRETEPLGK